MAQPTMRNQEQIMKQTSKALPKVNSDLRGRAVKLLRAIGDDMEYHITLEGKEYTRCGNQYFIRVKNSHNGPYPFWRVHHGKNVHTRIDAAIQDYEDAHTEALEMNAVIPAIAKAISKIENPNYQMQAMFWAANDHAGRCNIVEAAHTAALRMNEAHDMSYRSVSYPGCYEVLGSNQKRRAVSAAHAEALEINSKVDTDLAILRSDIKGFRREFSGARLEEVIDYAIRHTFNRIVQVYGVEIHRDSFTDLARTPEQKAFSGGMKTGANTDITTPLRIISDYMQRFMRNNKDAKLSEAKQRLESKIVLLINDGYDEQHLRQALSSATSSHSREAFLTAIKH